MKKILIALFLLAVCLFTVSCGDSDKVDAPDGMKLASSDNDRFYLFVPSSWTVDVSHGGPYAYYSSSDASNISANFYMPDAETTDTSTDTTDTTVSDTAVDTTAKAESNPREKYIDTYWNTFADSMNATVKEFTLIDSVETTLDSIYSKQYVYSFKIDDTVYKCRMVVTYPVQDLVFCLTYTSTPDNYDKHNAEFDKVISSFKFNF